MENQFQEEQRYLRAQKRVKDIKGFYRHLLWYVIINIIIIITIVAGYGWDFSQIFTFNAYSTALFWGIGLLFHAIGVFGKNIIFSKKWEERKIKEYMGNDFNVVNRTPEKTDPNLKVKERVKELKALYVHIAIAIILMPLFVYINYLTDGFNGFIWFWFPIGGIIISLILHAVTVFKIGTNWKDRKIKELMDKDDF